MLSKPPPWRVLRVKSGHELPIRDALDEHGVETLVPVRKGVRRVGRHRRRVRAAFPLLAGYVPVQGALPPHEALCGVSRHIRGWLSGADGLPAVLGDEDLAAIRAMFGNSERPAGGRFQPGTVVEVESGWLRGTLVRVEATFAGRAVVLPAGASQPVSLPLESLAA